MMVGTKAASGKRWNPVQREDRRNKTEAARPLALWSPRVCPGQLLLWLSNERKISFPCLKSLILVFVTRVKHASWPTLTHAYGSYFSAPINYCREGLGAQRCAFVQFYKRTWNPEFPLIFDFYILTTNSDFQHYTGQQNWSGDQSHFRFTGFSETKTCDWDN